MKNYKLDVIIARRRKFIKKFLPSFISEPISKIINHKDKNQVDINYLLDSPPWSSPNIWYEITNYYENISNPKIFEYGLGSSTINRLIRLIDKGQGLYIGVENNLDWFWSVIGALTIKASQLCNSVMVEKIGFNLSGDGEVVLRINNIKFQLLFRSQENSYVEAFNQHCDVIIIDGAFRKKCTK